MQNLHEHPKLKLIFTATFIVLTVSFLSFLLITISSSYAQEGTMPLPNAANPANQALSADQLIPSEPANYRIAYLAAPNAIPQGNLLANDGLLGELTKAQIAYSWDEIVKLDASAPLQSIIIHASAIDMVDRDWIASAWRRGTTVATLNLPLTESAALRNYSCASSKESNFNGDYYIVATQLIQADNDQDQVKVEREELQNCSEEYSVVGTVYITYKSSQGVIATERDVALFVRDLILQMDAVVEAKQNFNNRFVAPTPAPAIPGKN